METRWAEGWLGGVRALPGIIGVPLLPPGKGGSSAAGAELRGGLRGPSPGGMLRLE